MPSTAKDTAQTTGRHDRPGLLSVGICTTPISTPHHTLQPDNRSLTTQTHTFYAVPALGLDRMNTHVEAGRRQLPVQPDLDRKDISLEAILRGLPFPERPAVRCQTLLLLLLVRSLTYPHSAYQWEHVQATVAMDSMKQNWAADLHRHYQSNQHKLRPKRNGPEIPLLGWIGKPCMP